MEAEEETTRPEEEEEEQEEKGMAASCVDDQQPASASGAEINEGECLVGGYVCRGAGGRGRVLLGKVASYDAGGGIYDVVYEDGNHEDLGIQELREILQVGDAGASGMKMSCRKRKLDLLVSSGTPEAKQPPSSRPRLDFPDASVAAEVSSLGRSGSDVSDDAESSSNSSDSTKAPSCEPCPQVQIPELPPSSGDIAVPEESVSHLFSVYNFLRSFSIQLFLSPFGLEDFVGSLNCTVQNSLLDAVHVSLMRPLRRHLETISLEGSELASKCLRYQDWSLLDTLTWPAFLLEFLYVMGYIKDLGGQSFGISLSSGEYYRLPVSAKLRILQILCDHVIDSDELRTELETREGFDEELEHSIDASLPAENGIKVLCPRNSKTSASRKIEELQKSYNPSDHCPFSKAINQDVGSSDISQDGNSDECRLCGMDGTLVCCDGCPSAYHSRCIGLNKAFLPEGLWFCPDCMANKLGPTSSRIERGAKGAEVFGIDMCGRLFIGTCNYLLVIGALSNAEPYSRYYNQDDVVKVFQILSFSDAYADICKRMSEYWASQLSRLQAVKVEHLGDGNAGITLDNCVNNKVVIPSQKDGHHEPGVKQITLSSLEQVECSDKQNCNTSSNGVVIENKTEAAAQILLTQKNEHNVSDTAAFGVTRTSSFVQQNLSEQLANGSMVKDMSNIKQALSADRLLVRDLSTCGSGIDYGMSREDMGSIVHSAKADSSGLSYESKHPIQLIGEKYGSMSVGRPTKVLPFKPQAYVNLYIHGDVAASAAANLSVLTSDEGKVAESLAASNPKKALAAKIALQMKAFSSATSQFVWPSSEKKLMEVPRERCGWCIACKGSTASKRGCFLNLAATNAIKGSARNLSALRTIKNGESHLPSIVAHLANMEESLRGLLVGPLQDAEYKQRWHKQLREASNCRIIKLLLLELESNIRGIAFSGNWFKLIDDRPVEGSGVSGVVSRVGANQKRGTGGRRNKKRSLAPEPANMSNDDNWKEVKWWRGGKLSKFVLQRGVLLSSTIRKAGRQGGFKRISGVSYPEISDFPRRTRQFAWRASVGLSRNVSHLALQVRYLDAHIRWREFIPPDQIPSDGKASDADFSAFRNAIVCDKKMIENKTRYALKFSNRKHLPVRVTKNILEEDNQDENGKLWFSENYIPLYLIKSFEEKVGVKSSPVLGMLNSHCFSNFQRRRIKAYYGNIFSYLCHRGEVSPCPSCQHDVSVRDAIRCSSCQGNCHRECISSSVANQGADFGSDFICKSCHAKRAAQMANYKMKVSYQLPQQSNSQQLVTAPKLIFRLGAPDPALSASKMQAQPEIKSPSSVPKTEQNRKRKSSSANPSFGIVWKKKNGDETGDDFRIQNIILKSKDGIGSSTKPTCCLCRKPYCPDLMYIRCEKCLNWFHADAVHLEETQIFRLARYRCNKCRRRAAPKCPYADDYKKPELESVNKANAITKLSLSTAPLSISSEEGFVIPDDDPLLSSYGRVEPFGEQTVESDLQLDMTGSLPGGHQKLSVRRAQVKNVEYLDPYGITNNAYLQQPSYLQNQSSGSAASHFSDMNEFSASDANNMDASELLSPQLEWDFSHGDAYGGVPGTNDDANCQWDDPNYQNLENEEYEPQTYFSFTELLASEDSHLDNRCEVSTGVQDDGGYYAGNYNQHGIGFDVMAHTVQDESANVYFPANEPSFDGAACQKCKLHQPPPDLICEICSLHIHSHCSPWVESGESTGSGNWRCGGCREWR